jgi:hypothetical protein
VVSAVDHLVRIFRSIVDFAKDVIAIAFPDRIGHWEREWKDGPPWMI